MKKTLLAGIAALALTAGLTAAASAEVYNRTITLGSNMTGEFVLRDIKVGDDINLTLVNPTNRDLVFHTDAAIGTAETWTVPANSSRIVSFPYTVPFSDDVNFTVRDAAGATVAQGLLVDIEEEVADVFSRTITLGPNTQGVVTMEDLGIGDEVRLTLVNPTNQPLTFRTTQMLGPEQVFTVAPNSSRVISFTYNRPFDDDVEFVVLGPDNMTISQGILFDMDEGTIGEDAFRRTITLQPGMGEIVIEDLGIGDRVQLTLVNPTNQPLTFQTTEQLGAESTITVPANGQRLLSFDYTRPFDDDVEFQVMSPTGAVISSGVLIEGQQQTTTVQPERSTTVRGFW